MRLIDSVLCLGGRCQPRPKQGDVWREAKNCLFRLDPRALPALRHRRRAGRGSSRAFTHDAQWCNFSPKHKRCARARTYIQTSSKHQKRKEEVCTQCSTCVAAYAKVFPEGRWTFLEPEEEEQLVWESLLQATWEVQLRRSGHDVHLRRTRTSSIQVFKPKVTECIEK